MSNWRYALDIGALWALSIAYPLFDVLSRSPEFFVARNSTATHVVALVTLLCIVLPLTLFGIARAVTRTGLVRGGITYGTIVAALVMLLVMAWLNRVNGLATWVGVTMAVVAGAAVGVGYRRTQVVPLFVTALTPAVLVVPGWFLFNPGVQDALTPVLTRGETVSPDQTPPIVYIVFDEFPLVSLLDAQGDIDTGRYPHFADLGAHSYWFRNATTVSSETTWAVPALVAGVYPFERGAVPTRRYYPNNLFTMLRDRYEMTVFGRFLQLCPVASCVHDLALPSESVGRLAVDSAVVLGHTLLPATLTQTLPPVVGDWVGFARARGSVTAYRRDAEFERFLAAIEPGQRASLYFLHSLLPHMPFEFVPSGKRYWGPDYQDAEVDGRPLFETVDGTFADVLYQRHLLQVGFVDRLVGRLLARLRALDVFDDTLLIVTSDHGTSFQAGSPRRALTDHNVADIALVPLFVKVPGQRDPVVSTASVQTIDILPTVADILSVTLPFEVDGRSVFDDTEPGAKVFVLRDLDDATVETLGNVMTAAEISLQRKIALFGDHSATRLYGVGPAASLVGRAVSVLPVASSGEITVTAEDGRFLEADAIEELRPLRIAGRLGRGQTEPVSLAVAVNGVIVATTQTYRWDGGWRFATMVPDVGSGDTDMLELFMVIQGVEGTALSPVSWSRSTP